jgi:hypothetical protein
MRLFRSEEHIDRTLATMGIPRGATFSVNQCWTLAQHWFADRLSPSWRRRTIDEAHEIFAASGLTGSFWQLSPP